VIVEHVVLQHVVVQEGRVVTQERVVQQRLLLHLNRIVLQIVAWRIIHHVGVFVSLVSVLAGLLMELVLLMVHRVAMLFVVLLTLELLLLVRVLGRSSSSAFDLWLRHDSSQHVVR